MSLVLVLYCTHNTTVKIEDCHACVMLKTNLKKSTKLKKTILSYNIFSWIVQSIECDHE